MTVEGTLDKSTRKLGRAQLGRGGVGVQKLSPCQQSIRPPTTSCLGLGQGFPERPGRGIWELSLLLLIGATVL